MIVHKIKLLFVQVAKLVKPLMTQVGKFRNNVGSPALIMKHFLRQY